MAGFDKWKWKSPSWEPALGGGGCTYLAAMASRELLSGGPGPPSSAVAALGHRAGSLQAVAVKELIQQCLWRCGSISQLLGLSQIPSPGHGFLGWQSCKAGRCLVPALLGLLCLYIVDPAAEQGCRPLLVPRLGVCVCTGAAKGCTSTGLGAQGCGCLGCHLLHPALWKSLLTGCSLLPAASGVHALQPVCFFSTPPSLTHPWAPQLSQGRRSRWSPRRTGRMQELLLEGLVSGLPGPAWARIPGKDPSPGPHPCPVGLARSPAIPSPPAGWGAGC